MTAVKKQRSPYGAIKFQSIDEYHAAFTPVIQHLLNIMRKTIKSVVPGAEETISYNMPAFKINKVLVYYAACENHIGFYPTPSPIDYFKNELQGYKTSKGAIQFPVTKPLPLPLIKKIVRYRLKEDATFSVKAKRSLANIN